MSVPDDQSLRTFDLTKLPMVSVVTATLCFFRTCSADTEDELMAKVAEHVRKKHKVAVTTDTIGNFVRSKVRKD